jgi:hypothetical protein
MMGNCCSSSHGCGEGSYELSYKLAREQLAKISDIPGQCHKSGARCVGAEGIDLSYLNEQYHISVSDGEISPEGGKGEVPLRDKILILHYFIGAKGSPAMGKLIAYRQLPGGVSYFPAFSQRAIAPLVRNFGQNPELLMKAAAKLGGHEADNGDISVTVSAFPHVPVTLVLWRGDEEVPPNGNMLFDANIPDYLSSEDVTVLCETIVWKLVRSIPSA